MPEITNDLMDMIISDESPSSVSDTIKDILFSKTAEKVDATRPDVAKQTFDSPETAEEPAAEQG